MDQFVKLLQEDILNFNKLTKYTPEHLLSISVYTGDSRRGWDYYSRRLIINIDESSYKMYLHYRNNSFNSNREFDESFEYKDLLKKDLTNFTYWSEKVNILDEMCKAVYLYVVVPYINWKKTNYRSANAKNSQATLKKYNMVQTPSDYFAWLKNNIKNILKSNPDKEIRIKYHDWSGSIDGMYYSSKKNIYWMNVYMQSGNSDTNDADYLDNLLRLSSRDSYSYRYVDNDAMRYCRDTDDAIYRCRVDDLDALAEDVYNEVKDSIEKGILI